MLLLPKSSLRSWLWLYACLSILIFTLTFVVLGFLTPGYDQLAHTISRLAIMKYGPLQQINFVQFAVNLVITGYLLSRIATRKQSKQVFFFTSLAVAGAIVMATLFPTDGHSWLTDHRFTLSGYLHCTSVVLLLFISPFGAYRLRQSLSAEPALAKYRRFTSILVTVVLSLAVLWGVLYFSNTLVGYLGLLQKIIVVLGLSWLARMLWVIRPQLVNQSL